MKESPAPALSVVIPVYNEEPNVPTLCARLDEALRACGRSYEVILVDDGSSDGTWPAPHVSTRFIVALDSMPCS